MPERGHVALSAVGLVAAPSTLEPRWTDGDFDQAVDVHRDGGRWADWRTGGPAAEVLTGSMLVDRRPGGSAVGGRGGLGGRRTAGGP